jgi:hypothetical protein
VKLRTRTVVLSLLAATLALPALPASAEDPAPAVTLTPDKTVYVAGQTARLTSKITAHNLDWQVSVQFPGSTDWRQLCASYDVNDSVRTCTLGLTYNVKVRALLIDDKGTSSTSDDTLEALTTRSIGVKASLATSPMGYYTKSGSYAVYSKGYSPKFRSASYPGFPGKRCLRHQVQRRYASGWKTVSTSACKVEGKQGRVDWQWAGRHASGVKFRVRVTFAGDSVNKANVGRAFYFRFR